MKKILLTLTIILSALTIYAEDVLQVKPFHTTAGITTDDMLSFSFEMNNASADIWAFQFDILLPEGMTLDNTDGLDPFELNEDRCPFTTDRKGQKTWSHTVQYNLLSNGWYRIAVFNTKDELRFTGNSGEILRAYFLTDENMVPGVYPIYVKETVLTITGSTDIKPMESSSYVVIGETSPLKTERIPDLSSLTGYIPSWVVSSINTEIEQNTSLVGVNLSGISSLGASLSPLNKNTLFYVSDEADMTDKYDCGSVVYTGKSYKCEVLNLYSGNYDFYTAETIQGVTANYDLNMKEMVYTTLCLPFALSQEQVTILKEKGVTIEKMTAYSQEKAELTFTEVYETEANVPYLVKCNSSIAPFVELEIDKIADSDNMADVVLDDVKMLGLLSSSTIVSNDTETYYIYDGGSDKFVKVDEETEVLPFHAFIKVNSGTALQELSISHYNDEVVAVESVITDTMQTVDVYTVLGHKIRSNMDVETATEGLDCGVYIVGNKKVLVK